MTPGCIGHHMAFLGTLRSASWGPQLFSFPWGQDFTHDWNNFHQNYCELDVALTIQAFKNGNHFLFILTETVCENYKASPKNRFFENVSKRIYKSHSWQKVFSDVPALLQRYRTRYAGMRKHIFHKRSSMPIVQMEKLCLYICFAYTRKHI